MKHASIIALLLAAAALAACGVKGDPQLPAEASDTYPGTYPQGATPGARDNIFGSRRR